MTPLKFVTIFTAACLSSSGINYAAAATVKSEQSLEQLIDKIVTQRTQKLQNQVISLQSEVKGLKQELAHSSPHAPHKENNRSRPHKLAEAAPEPHGPPPETETMVTVEAAPVGKPVRPVENVLHFGGIPVFSSPYVGIHSEFDGTDLIVLAPNVNLDVRLLKQAQGLQSELVSANIALPNNPVVDLSGKVEGQVLSTRMNGDPTRTDVELGSAELDTFAAVNPWTSAFIAFAFDNSATSPERVTNSRIFLSKGFVTLGNFNRSPFYGSLGQYFVPFGQYNSYMVSSPITSTFARTKARAITLGGYPMHNKGFYGTAYAFTGDTTVNDHHAGGVSAGYKTSNHDGSLSLDLNAGVISNVAEADGIQLTGAPEGIPFKGFAQTNSAENLQHAIPALDLNGNLSIGHFSVLAEYVRALDSYSPLDMTFNGCGAQPQALHVEGAYRFSIQNKPASFALGYDWTHEALAYFLPRERVLATLNISFLRNTIASLEYRHEMNYSLGDFATGAGSLPFSPLSKTGDMLTAQFGVYF